MVSAFRADGVPARESALYFQAPSGMRAVSMAADGPIPKPGKAVGERTVAHPASFGQHGARLKKMRQGVPF